MLTRKSKNEVLEPEQQYAVVLLNEEQLGQFMRRPGMRQANRGFSVPDVHARYLRLRRQTTAAVALLLVLGTGGFLYSMAPQPAVASMFAWKEAPSAPTLATGASFSVTVASLDSNDAAGYAAARVSTLGFPSFTRLSPGRRQLHQAMAGPYASIDEAERAQRRLARSGFPGARIFVDETLRDAPRNEIEADVLEGNPALLLIGAPERLSLVFELPGEARQVRTRRNDNVLDLDVGPLETRVQPQQWSAPEGVHLVERVSIEGVQASQTGQFLRAHVSVPEFARANVRTEGKRVYVDLTWPTIAPEMVSPRSVLASAAPAKPPAPRPAPATVQKAQPDDKYDQALRAVLDRVIAVKPFLMSAAQSGSLDVLVALDDTLATLDSSLKGMRPPASAADQHQMLMSAVRTARKATDPSYSGDRMAQAREAFILYDAAMNAASVTPVGQ